jgi:hypothetical protein
MEISNLTSALHNHDYDGDNMIAGALHSEEAKHDFAHMFVNNNIEFEQRDSLLFDWEHEAIYASYMYTKIAYQKKDKNQAENKSDEAIVVKNFAELREKYIDFEIIKSNDSLIYIENLNETLTLADWLINRCLHRVDWDETSDEFTIYHKDKVLNKKSLNNLLWRFYNDLKANNRHDELWNLGHELDKFLMEIGTTIDYCNPSFNLNDFAVNSPEITEYKKNLIQNEPYLAFHQNMVLFEDYVGPEVKKNDDNILHKVSDSGARLKSVQLLKAASNTGIPTNIYGKAIPRNIEHSLLDGLTQKEYYETGDSARLALMQRQDSIPRGGELQRKFFFSTGILHFEHDIEDCQADVPIDERKTVNVEIKDKSHLKSLNHRWFINEETKEDFYLDIETTDEDWNDFFEDMIGNIYRMYSPRKCQVPTFGICKKCFGKKTPTSKHVGASLGSYIAEGIIQSVLRAHHFGGAFITELDYKILDILKHSKITSEADETLIETSKENIELIIEYLFTKYNDGDLEINTTDYEDTEKGESTVLSLKVINLPYNDDSVKILTSIVSLIDKNRKADKFIRPNDIYNSLVEVITQNDLLSVYFEMILSLIFYDEDDNICKYSDKPACTQIALKNIIEKLDPKLSIFYNFSNRAIANVYKNENAGTEETGHMYNELLEMYY